MHTKGEQVTSKKILPVKHDSSLLSGNHHVGQYLQLCVLLWWTSVHHVFLCLIDDLL